MASSDSSPALKRRRIIGSLVLGLAALGAVAGFWFARPTPARLLERGLALGKRDPVSGQRLLERAIDKAGGHYPDAELGLCLILAQQGEWVSSRLAGLDFAECRSDLLLAFARAALRSGRADQARAALAAVRVRNAPESIAALELYIASFADSGPREEPIAAARELTEHEPANSRYWKLLIHLLKRQVRREPECLAAIRAALAHDLPDESRRSLKHELVGQLIVCGDAREARQQWEELSQTEEASLPMRLYEIDILRLEGRLSEALEAMNSVFPELGDRPRAHLNRGVIFLDMGRFEEARRDLEQAVAADPDNASAHFKLSEAWRGLGRQDQALRHREAAIAIGRRQERIEKLLRAAQEGPDGRSACLQLAELYRELHDEESARKWQTRADQFRGREATEP